MDIAKQFLSKEHCDYFYSVPSSLVLSVGTESTMRERLEKEYKSKDVRLKTAFKYNDEHTGLPNDKQIVPLARETLRVSNVCDDGSFSSPKECRKASIIRIIGLFAIH